MPAISRSAILGTMIVAPWALLAIASGCHSGSQQLAPQAIAKEASATFAGNAACVACHKNECEHQSDTNHARSLRHADVYSLASLAPPVGHIAGTNYSMVRQAGSFRLIRDDNPGLGVTLQYAFGSGASIMTYVGDVGPNTLTEVRMSYSPRSKQWYTTPSQANDADLGTGHVYQMGMATRCVLCHADRIASTTTAPAEGSLGIGCESCHGPGGAHIAAERVPHALDLKIEKIGTWNASRINSMCGRCHRTINDVSLVGSDASNTARFQAYGIELSPCFKKSGDRLSCVTCHDPHSDAGAGMRQYEKTCLSCHSHTAEPRKFTYPVEATLRKVCPVNPKEGCIPCHMPKRPIMPGTKIPLSIADHLIWAYPPHQETKNDQKH